MTKCCDSQLQYCDVIKKPENLTVKQYIHAFLLTDNFEDSVSMQSICIDKFIRWVNRVC